MEEDNTTLLYDKQIKFEGNAYLDPKQMPVQTYSQLLAIPSEKLFDGIEISVVADETMDNESTRYAYKNGEWVLIKPTSEILISETNAYISFLALENNSKLKLNKISSHQSIEYSLNIEDPNSWLDFTTAVTITLQSGEIAYVRGELSGNNNADSDYTNFKIPSGSFSVGGNINSLWNYEDLEQPLYDYCGFLLFGYECAGLTDANSLELPSETLSEGCYAGMFFTCTNLNRAPELPATTLASNCYEGMFYGCVSLTTVPEVLPATILVDLCYEGMFVGCTSLTTAPELPATTLANGCYVSMFGNCTSLTTAPALPATTLANGCYGSMFGNCTSLTTAPALPATTVSNACYALMFNGCTSLTEAPELPAATLSVYCYTEMFEGCTNLNYIKCLAINNISEGTYHWVQGVQTNSGTFIKAASMNDWPIDSVDGIPTGWTVQNA